MDIDFDEWESDNLNVVAKRHGIEIKKMRQDIGLAMSDSNFLNILDGGTCISPVLRNKILAYIDSHKQDGKSGNHNNGTNPS